MATRKRLNFSTSDDGFEDGDNDTSPSSLLKSPSSSHTETETPKKTKKSKKKRKVSTKQIWTEDDEITILKGLVEFRVKRRSDPVFDRQGFFDFIKGSIRVNVTKDQLMSKLRKLKRRFTAHKERIEKGNDPLFTRSTDSQAFGYATMIWDQNETNGDTHEPHTTTTITITTITTTTEDNGDDEQMCNDEPVNANVAEKITVNTSAGCSNGGTGQTHGGDDGEPVDNAEPVNDNGAEYSKLDGQSLHDDKTTKHTTAGNEAGAVDAAMKKAQQICKGKGKQVDDAEPLNDNVAEGNTSDGNLLPEAEFANGGMEGTQQTHGGEDAPMDNAGPSVNDNDVEKSKAEGKSIDEVVGNRTADHRTVGTESHDGDDEFCEVEDAYETMLAEGLSVYQKKKQLEKLRRLEGETITELSNEWKTITAEGRRLRLKKIKFAAKLAEALGD